jgi:hypothetical protein
MMDGRYRDIPVIDFSVPVGGIALLLGFRLVLALGQGGKVRAALSFDGLFAGRRRLVTRLLAWLLPIAAAASLLSDSLEMANARDFLREHPAFQERIVPLLQALVANRELDLWAAMLLLWSLPFIMAKTPEPGAATSR